MRGRETAAKNRTMERSRFRLVRFRIHTLQVCRANRVRSADVPSARPIDNMSNVTGLERGGCDRISARESRGWAVRAQTLRGSRTRRRRGARTFPAWRSRHRARLASPRLASVDLDFKLSLRTAVMRAGRAAVGAFCVLAPARDAR